MGKNRHSKDRLFITQTEHKRDYGGKKAAVNTGLKALPFDNCALSLSPFEIPCLLGITTGVIFDFEQIVPFVQQHKSDPVTGEAVTTKDIIRLDMQKNSEGAWHCPVSYKQFTNLSHVVAVKTSSTCYVYAYEAVNELNIKSKNFTDLITGEKFKKSDIITLQNPQGMKSSYICDESISINRN